MAITKHLTLCCFLTLPACGVIYTAPNVKAVPDRVDVIELTPQTVTYANKISPYTPRKIPAVFNHVTHVRGSGNIGVIPQKALQGYRRPSVSLPSPTQAGPYKLGVSDVVLLATPTPQSLEALTGLIAAQNKRQGYTIQDDGAIAVPDIGRINLAGLTIEEAEAVIFQALVENQISPQFSLEIAEFNSKTVSVGGAVKAAMVAPITLKPLTLQNALQIAGGIETSTPEFTTIRIFRNGKSYQIPLQELSAQPKLQSLVLQDGDSVYVEDDFQKQQALVEAKSLALKQIEAKAELQRAQSDEARRNFLTRLEIGAVERDYAYLAGEVKNQGRIELPFVKTASVADIIYGDGGILNKEGDLGQIYVLRILKGSQHITAYHLDGGNVVNLILATKMKLRPDDVVFVAEQRVTSWNRVISQILPSFSLAKSVASD